MKYKLIIPEELTGFETKTFIDSVENNNEIDIDVFQENKDLIIELSNSNEGRITIFEFGKNIFSMFVKPAYNFTSDLFKITIEKDYNKIYFHVAGFPNNPIILEKINTP